MNIIRNLGIALSGHVENSTKVPTDKILKLINDWNAHKQQLNDMINKQQNIYAALYENPRLENSIKYSSYLAERAEIYNIWKNNGDKASLFELIKFSKPDFQEVPEIYTYTSINPYYADKKPKEAKPKEAKPKTKTMKPTKTGLKKECPEGKIYNPVTGRCITDPSLKKAKAVREPVEKKIDKEPEEKKVAKEPKKPKEKKECPEGKILNEATGRCIADPSLKKAKDPKEKKTKKTEKEN